jgi:hypothetical protein
MAHLQFWKVCGIRGGRERRTSLAYLLHNKRSGHLCPSLCYGKPYQRAIDLNNRERVMPKKNITVTLIASMVALMLITWANAVTTGPTTLPPYTGIIKNNTSCDFSLMSQNSMGTLILPAKGWIEFVVWDPKFDVVPYYNGKPFGCQKVTVTPKGFPFMCKEYDFMVEINGPGPCPAEQQYKGKYKRRVRKRRPC